MNLDTEKLKAKIQNEVSRIEQQKADLHNEIARLDDEKARLHETVSAVEAVEKIAGEIEVLHRLDAVPPESEAAPASSEEPADSDSQPIQDFKQWA